MIWAATGHRPDRLGGYGADIEGRLIAIAEQWITEAEPAKVIIGMALGWDQAVGKACLTRGVPYVAAVPFIGQANKWPPESQAGYWRLLDKASSIVTISDGPYTSKAMQLRNRWMVDNCESVVALWDGFLGSGTANCIEYALKKRRPIVNLWSRF